MSDPLSHAALVELGRKWLVDQGCWPVLTEPEGCDEQPDAIGWSDTHGSIVIDCKVSEADFHADRIKTFRRKSSEGMGQIRFYLCESGVVENWQARERGWGLLVVRGGAISSFDWPGGFVHWNILSELYLLRVAVRNLSRHAGKDANDARPCSETRPSQRFTEAAKILIAANPDTTANWLVKTAEGREVVKLAPNKRRAIVWLNEQISGVCAIAVDNQKQ